MSKIQIEQVRFLVHFPFELRVYILSAPVVPIPKAFPMALVLCQVENDG